MSIHAMQQNFDAVRDINAIRATLARMFNPLMSHVEDVKSEKVKGAQALTQLLQVFETEHKQLDSCRDNLLFWQEKEKNLDGQVRIVLATVMETVTNLTHLLDEAIAEIKSLSALATNLENACTYFQMDMKATAPTSAKVH
jgi:hypothetical protein